MEENETKGADRTLADLPAKDEADGGALDAESVKGGLLSASQLTSAAVLKQSSVISTSVDPGKVQGFQCDAHQ